MSGDNPDKLYLRIGEAAELLDVKPSVLRFWESQFPELVPRKSRTGQRLYNQQELAMLREIRRLLYDEKLTIEGARKRLAGRKLKVVQEESAATSSCDEETQQLMQEVRQELLQIAALLKHKV